MKMNKTAMSALALSDPKDQEGTTSFSKLSTEAQTIIVLAAMGGFNESGPPEMSETVKEEISSWISEPQEGDPAATD
jgi:phage replication-related protein YjqB (UPF0714/DUF867 family)